MPKFQLKLHVEIRRRNEWEHYDFIQCLIEKDIFKHLLVPHFTSKKIFDLNNFIFKLIKGLPISANRRTLDHFFSEKDSSIYCSYISGKQIEEFNYCLKNKELDNNDLLEFLNDLIEKKKNIDDLQDMRYVFWCASDNKK